MRPLLRSARTTRRPTLQTCACQCLATSSRLSSTTSESTPTTPRSSPAAPFPKVIFSGIQPTGIPHLGNYLGALRQWTQLCRTEAPGTKLVFSLVDLHAITRPQDPEQLRRWRRESFACLMAVGVDVERAVVFEQSMVPEHVELMWILSTFVSVGALRRMTQWKDKLGVSTSPSPSPADNPEEALLAAADAEAKLGLLKLGLFSYPVLQAADILIHRATHVPVGEDQSQHLELTRNIAGSFNHAYGKQHLPLPATLLSPARRVMSLTDPSKKMSKSALAEGSRILLTDSEEVIRGRFKRALTDSLGDAYYDVETRPGVANLIEIAAHVENVPLEEMAERTKGMKLKDLKFLAAEKVVEELRPIREMYNDIMAMDKGYIDEVALEGAKKARQSARETMKMVREVVGLADPYQRGFR